MYKTFRKTKRQVSLLVLIAFLFLSFTLVGCRYDGAPTTSGNEPIRTIFRIQETMTATQLQYIILFEAILIIFLVLLVALILTQYSRYRRAEKRANAARMEAYAIVKENEMKNRISQMKTEVFQNMSHDFKTPLTVISTSVYNVIDIIEYEEEMDREEMKESLNVAQEEIMRMSRMLSDVMAKTSAQVGEQNKDVIDFPAFMEKVIKTHEIILEENGNKLTYEMKDPIKKVFANTDDLFSVFSNIISNSNRFTENGKIEVTVSFDKKARRASDEQKALVTIRDTGIGIKPEMLENVFNRGITSGSTGLGLSICRKIIEENGGVITVDSEYGVGTEVAFTLPMSAS